MATLTTDAPISAKLKAEAARHGAGDAQAGLAKRDREGVAELVCGDKRPGPTQSDSLFEEYERAFDKVTKREDLVDAASEMSFPASDPPSYMGGASVAGAPNPDTPTEKPNTKVSDPTDVKPAQDHKPAANADKNEQEAAGGYNRAKPDLPKH